MAVARPDNHAVWGFRVLPRELRDEIWDATLEPKLLRIGIGSGGRTPVARGRRGATQ